ncbi:MAG: hypothetical protein ABW072_16125 [Sedimenticola sp.]
MNTNTVNQEKSWNGLHPDSPLKGNGLSYIGMIEGLLDRLNQNADDLESAVANSEEVKRVARDLHALSEWGRKELLFQK